MSEEENCRMCGEELIGYKKFCGSCGSEVRSAETVEKPAVELEDVPDTPVEAQEEPTESIEELMKKASEAMKNKDMDGSLEAIDKALEIDPQNSKAWNNKAVILAKKGKADDAIAAFDRAIEISPQVVNLWIAKGTVLLKVGKKELAKSSFQKALDIEPDNKMAAEKLAKCQ